MLIPVKDICGKSGVISGKDAKKTTDIIFSIALSLNIKRIAEL